MFDMIVAANSAASSSAEVSGLIVTANSASSSRAQVMDKTWLGCDACGKWHKCREQVHELWAGRFMTCADVGGA